MPLPTDTPHGRLKQIGLMTPIGCLHQARQPVTLFVLTRLTGLSRASVAEITGQLVARGFLTETLGKNSMGRGTAWLFSISETLLDHVASLRKSAASVV